MPVPPTESIRILLVEDDPDIRETMTDLLEFEGYRVVAAVSGMEAQLILASQPFNLVVTDAVMANGDGYTLLDHIRRQESLRSLPVIMTSAKANKADVLKGFEHGADEYLTKPYQLSELVELARSLIAGRRERRTQPRDGVAELSPP